MGSQHITMSIVVSPEIEKALRDAAARNEHSVSWIARRAIEAYLKLQRKPSAGKSRRR